MENREELIARIGRQIRASGSNTADALEFANVLTGKADRPHVFSACQRTTPDYVFLEVVSQLPPGMQALLKHLRKNPRTTISALQNASVWTHRAVQPASVTVAIDRLKTKLANIGAVVHMDIERHGQYVKFIFDADKK